jgi:hypothetical protein
MKSLISFCGAKDLMGSTLGNNTSKMKYLKRKQPDHKGPVSLCTATVYIIAHFILAVSYSSPKGVPSPQESLTSVFGMRTGVTSPMNHQNKMDNLVRGEHDKK